MRAKICGQSLNSWTMLIGYLYLIQAIVSASAIIADLVKYKEDKRRATTDAIPYDQDREVVSTLCVSLSFSLAFVLTSPFLLWGVHKGQYKYLVPWLYNSIACIVVNCIYLFVTVFKNIYKLDKTKHDLYMILFMAFMMSFGLILQTVFYRIVYKLYKELRAEHVLEYLENASTIFIMSEE